MVDVVYAIEDPEEEEEELETFTSPFDLESWEAILYEEEIAYNRWPTDLPVSSLSVGGVSLEIKFWDRILFYEIRQTLVITLGDLSLDQPLDQSVLAELV